MIGKCIKKYAIPRQKLVILTKCYGTVGEEPGVRHITWPAEIKRSKDYVNQGGLSRTAIFNAVDASLKRLGVDYIDLLQIHRYDATVSPEETMEALHDLVKSGKVRYIGASSMWTYQFAKLQFAAERNGWTKFVSMQNHYSLCYREEEREMNKFCLETGVGLIPWAPLFRGYLARPLDGGDTTRSKTTKGTPMNRELTETDKKIIGRVEELAGKKGWKMSQVSLAWIIQRGTIPIVGFSNLGRLDEACEVRGKSLTPEEMKYLEEPYEPNAIVGHG
jgi:aryl-alcohol dehydrogenase-like predicted oxidoreductase